MSHHIFSIPSILRAQRATPSLRPTNLFPSLTQQPQRQTRTLKLYASSKHALRKSTCLITGASRGIGRAIAIAFAREGAICYLVGRDEAALKETYDLCTSARGSLGRPHAIIPGDITDADFWSTLDKHSAWNAENGRLDVLVNAAGVTHSSLLLRTSTSKIDEVVSTNLIASISACRFAAKKMLRNSPPTATTTTITATTTTTTTPTPSANRGHILNISSILATHSGAGSAAYAASKAGILGLTRSLAAELGPRGIRVNAISPGYIETDMTRSMSDTAKEDACNRIPAGRFGSVDEVADAAVFLSGNQYACNCVLNLDGGLSAL